MHCPTDDELRRYAQDAETDAGLDEHVQQCATCQRRLESLTGDSEVLAELRSAWTDKLNDSAERRIAEICRDVSEKLPPGEHGRVGPTVFRFRGMARRERVGLGQFRLQVLW